MLDSDWFDLYTARDIKGNNMRHIMGKNYKNENSITNIEKYIVKYKLNREKAELAWLKLGKFTNKFNKIPMIEEANQDAPYEACSRFYNNKKIQIYHK
jgi:hypothetical protein